MANRSIARDGLQELCIVDKQENLYEGNRAGKVINVQQKQKGPKMLNWGMPELTWSKSEE